MARRHHYRRLQKEAPELNITTFLNLMVVLVPFLLITAVFSRVTILELSLPTGGSSSSDKQQLTIEVIVREKGLEIGNGKQVLARFPLLKAEDVGAGIVDEEGEDVSRLYDLKLLSKYLIKIKAKYPEKTDALVLMEADIEYRTLIRVMDAVRSAFIRQLGAEGEADVLQQVVLFPDISIGDAP
ncbi:MAG: biopolymer transporter ExbD [Gammaproteobacteria bacterium]|nr:biopolymer transporter ExbD [Gammaproteobacteria bacterium]